MQLRLGKDLSFYALLEAQAEVALRASQGFYALVQDFDNLETYAKAIAQIEHEGDDLTHQLQNKVATTFMTPLDKEDLRDLSQALDDITDFVEAAAARTQLYRLSNPRPDLEPLAKLLVEAAEVVVTAVKELGNGFNKSTTLKGTLREIHSIENDSDIAFRTALASLFEQPNPDVLMVIKWKEIYDRIETAVDKCEDIAKIIGTIVVKYA